MNRADDDKALFVYGSLTDPIRRHEIIGHPVEVIPASIDDYELRRSRYFFIRRCPGATTAGLLLLHLTADDFERLDRYEEIPRLYTREKVTVSDQKGNKLRCWAYLPTRLLLASHPSN
jgi:gamma-glutamylcyclotransferase (GGCT)/AIG2-like uncharacterized protein YtfP